MRTAHLLRARLAMARVARLIAWVRCVQLVAESQRLKKAEEGDVRTTTDPKGQGFTYVYDELNRQTDALYPDEPTSYMTIRQVHRVYDENNNVTAVTETKKRADGVSAEDGTENTYDQFDRLLESVQSLGKDEQGTTNHELRTSFTYDDNGNRTSVSTPAGATTYTYDSRNRLLTAVEDGGGVTTYSYYPDGKRDTVAYPSGAEMVYTYHPTNRVKTITNSSGGQAISSYLYFYDTNGNRISQTESTLPPPLPNQGGELVVGITTYMYDKADRMSNVSVSEEGSSTVTQYTFEGYNRKTEKVTTDGVITKDKTYTYDESDWLMSIADSVQHSAISYEYDYNGNMVRKVDSLLPGGDVNLAYDSRDQLVEVTRGPPGSATVLGRYDYNADGMRVRHRNSERGDVDYYYDGKAVIEEHNAADDSLLAFYRYGDRLLSLFTTHVSPLTEYYHYDALGSTVNLTDSLGSVATSYKLDPWGHIKLQLGNSLNRHIFTGQETDENTGLIYFGARYYDPDTARFITEDSYRGEQGTPPSLNRYLYAYGNPTVYIDLEGYFSAKEAWNAYKELLNYTPLGQNVAFAKAGLGVISSGLDYLNKKLDDHVGTSPSSHATFGALTAARLVLTVGKGIVDTPRNLDEQVDKFVDNPSLSTLPVLGEMGTNLGESSAAWNENKSLENTARLVGSVSSVFLTVAPFLPKGPTLSLTGTVGEEAALTVESRVGQAAMSTTAVDGSSSMMQRMLRRIETAYRESPFGNETGAVGWDAKSFRWRDPATGRFVKTPGGARSAPIELTEPGERFVRLGAEPRNLKWTFDNPGGLSPGTYAVPEEVFDAVGRNPLKLKDLLDLPGEPPTVYRTMEPPEGTKIQRGAVPGGEFGGRGRVPEVFFPEGF